MANPAAKIEFYNLRRGDAPALALSEAGTLPPDFDLQCALLGAGFYDNLPPVNGKWRKSIMKKVTHIVSLTAVNNWLAQ